MNQKHKTTVEAIDKYIRQHTWFDFHVWRYDGHRLTLAGSMDLTYYHQLEIIFSEVFFASTFFETWCSDTTKPVIILPDPTLNKTLNIKFEIEQGYQIFILKTEDYKNDIYIAAKEIAFNIDKVLYYEKEDLKENERLADFVIKNKFKNK